MKIKHIIFDMDGTLTDTAKATAIAIFKIEKQYKLPSVTEEDIRSVMGIGGFEFFTRLYPSVPVDILVNVERDVDDLEDAAIRDIGEGILFPGVARTLTELSNKGYFLYIASTGSKSHVYTTLSSTGIEKLFTSVSCGEPEKALMVKNIIEGRNSEGWCMVGDMHKDSDAARANDILALGAGYGYLSNEDVTLFDSILSKPEDIYMHL